MPTSTTIPTGARRSASLAAASFSMLDEFQPRWVNMGPKLDTRPWRRARLRSRRQSTICRSSDPALGFGVNRKILEWPPLESRPTAVRQSAGHPVLTVWQTPADMLPSYADVVSNPLLDCQRALHQSDAPNVVSVSSLIVFRSDPWRRSTASRRSTRQSWSCP